MRFRGRMLHSVLTAALVLTAVGYGAEVNPSLAAAGKVQRPLSVSSVSSVSSGPAKLSRPDTYARSVKAPVPRMTIPPGVSPTEVMLPQKGGAASARGLSAATPPSVTGSFEGAYRRGSDPEPPDPHAADGANYIVQVTNSHFDIFYKYSGADVQTNTLNGFFSSVLPYNPYPQLFDPRVVYDPNFSRFVIVADGHHDNTGRQWLFVAVSQTSNPRGLWYEYKFLLYSTQTFLDQPQLGMSYYSVVVSGTVFEHEPPGGGYLTTYVWAWPKSAFYAGQNISIKAHNAGTVGTAPPAVTVPGDKNQSDYILASGNGGSNLYMFRMFNGGFATESFTGPTKIPVPAFASPQNLAVRQVGTPIGLDPLDAGFHTAPVQNGAGLWAVHTILAADQTPVPRFYQINIQTATVYQKGLFYRSATSYDWNPAIVANNQNFVFVTWSATDPANGINAEVRASGRQPSDALGVIGHGVAVVRSATYFRDSTDTKERWGDYSAAVLDPVQYSATCPAYYRAWIVNEDIRTHYIWGSRLGQLGFC